MLKLILAHLVGDFVLQPSEWVRAKEAGKFRSAYLYLHILVHLIAVLAVLEFEKKYWLAYLLVPLSHMVIDVAKSYLSRKFSKRMLYFADQMAHILVIVGLSRYYQPWEIYIRYSDSYVLLAVSLLLITFVASTTIGVLFTKWSPELGGVDQSLVDAGKYIGILERLFVFALVIAGSIQSIGFLLAAKSVFRFGDLSKAKDRKLTEYMLIGTLLSFGIAAGVAWAYLLLKQKIL